MSFDFGSFNNWGKLKRVAIRDIDASFVSDTKIDAEWKDLNYHSRPDLILARKQYAALEQTIRNAGADVIKLPADPALTLDSIYTHDALVVTPKGLVMPRMGKIRRRKEAEVNGSALAKLGFPIAGLIGGEGKLEGGDLVWLDEHTLMAGVGYRTNQEGLRQLSKLMGKSVEILSFDMPHYRGKSDVFHLMSCLSPLDKDLAVVYLPLMAARQVECLEQRGIKFVEVPQNEFDSMGCNVLALGPRQALMVDRNPETKRRMEAAGVKVEVYEGSEISRKGEGGPTCLTRPLVRG